MLTSALMSLAAHACLGEWNYLPANLDLEVGFQLSIEPSNAFTLMFTDYSKTNGSGERQADGALLLQDSDGVFKLTDCDAESAQVEFPDGRIFTVTRDKGEFWDTAREPEGVLIEVPEWTTRRFARWTVSRTLVNVRYHCILTMRGGQGFRVDLYDRADVTDSISLVVATIQQPMSNLRARTNQFDLIGAFVFDGDVVQTGLRGYRVGREGTLYIGNLQTFLTNLSLANRVSLILSNDVIATVNLDGSAAAVAALRQCQATL
jgi:hypothetical protein